MSPPLRHGFGHARRGGPQRHGMSSGGGYAPGDFDAADGLSVVSVVPSGADFVVTMTDGTTNRAQTFTASQMAAIEAGTLVGYIYRNVSVDGSGNVALEIWAFTGSTVTLEITTQGYVGSTQNPAWVASTFNVSGEANWQLQEIGVIVTPTIGSPFTLVGQQLTYARFNGASGADLIETNVNIGGVLWDFHHFRTPGSFSKAVFDGYVEAEIIASAGEAARSSFGAAPGGAAGQRRIWTGLLTGGSVSLTVAAALSAVALGSTNYAGRKGNSSFFNGVEAEGGGGGRPSGVSGTEDGASGAGAAGNAAPGRATQSGVTGYDGGNGVSGGAAGGGGGMGGPGGAASGQDGGRGGDGILSDFTGTPRPVCAGGGGSGASGLGGAGGTNGGGAGGVNNANGGDATTPGSAAGGARRSSVNVRPGLSFRGEIVVKVKAAA